ncbi:unnamed protein product, partial [Medioppia subpectinata]
MNQLMVFTSVDVNTTSGLVIGQTVRVLDASVDQFLGIPYAEPPIGALRVSSMGQNRANPDHKEGRYLRQTHIFKVKTSSVAFVAANYGLGHLGSLYGDREDAPGNVGLYDQLMALKWVREKAEQLGGDRDQITIFGGSAGSWSASAHLLSPLSKGLFKRAIMQSSAHMYSKDRDVVSKDESILSGKRIAKEQNCSESEDWLQSRRRYNGRYASSEGSMLAQDYVKNMLTLNNFIESTKTSDSVYHGLDVKRVDDYYLQNVHKNSSLELKKAFYKLFGDLVMRCPTYLFVRQTALNGQPGHNVYFYQITYQNKYIAHALAAIRRPLTGHRVRHFRAHPPDPRIGNPNVLIYSSRRQTLRLTGQRSAIKLVNRSSAQTSAVYPKHNGGLRFSKPEGTDRGLGV